MAHRSPGARGTATTGRQLKSICRSFDVAITLVSQEVEAVSDGAVR